MAFQDSHFKPSYTGGYQWKAIWRPAEDVRLGLGYLAGLMSRSDILSYVPFPIVFPVASVAYKNFSLEGTYIPPGGDNAGNVLFIWAKWEMGKTGEAIGTPAQPAPPTPTEMANASFGPSTPVTRQRVPYGPVLEPGSTPRLVSSSETVPPVVRATGRRDEEEVPDPLPSLVLQPSRSMVTPPKDSAVSRPVFLSAYRMGGDIDREFNAEGEAELRKIGTVVNADRLTYWPIDDEIEAEGNARLEQGEDLITGPKMRLKLEDQVGFFEQPSYTIKRQPSSGGKAKAETESTALSAEQQDEDSWLTSGFASPQVLDIKPGQTSFDYSKQSPRRATVARGEADRIDFEGENQVRMTNATYTTCEPGNDDWYAKAGSLKLDYDREVAEGTDGTVYFLGTPILYSPWLSFSLNNQRKSGFLAPTFGTSSNRGIELAMPYYWNIAPNMDATIAPRVMTKRGVQLNNEFRYLNTAFGGTYRGELHAEVLPNDRERNGENRYGYSVQHNQAMANGFSGVINYGRVSDDDYFTDLSSQISHTSQVNILQQGVLSYGGGGWWNATANFQQYQTLQPDPENPTLYPYQLLPQFTVTARRPDLYMTDTSFFGQYTNFTIKERIQNVDGVPTLYPDGQRTVLYPQVALPYVTPGWYVTPKIGVNVRHYELSGQAAGTPGSINTTLPIFSIDSGMTFERPSNWFGRDYTQTLEPRLFYVNIPYKNQEQIPIFDSGLADFNFAQIFSENQFSGWDRINNANQLTAAMTTRLIEPSSGNEIMRAMFGQRFYFTRNKVELNASTSTPTEDQSWQKSDVLAAFSGQILPKVYADAAWQYNLNDRQVNRFSMGGHYRPEPGKVFNAAYRYNRDPNAPIDQVDFSGQWPLTGRWTAVGRFNFSFKDDATNTSTATQNGRLIESIAGLEYNGGCWVVRGVAQQIALTQDKTSTGFFIQLELNDFSRIGSNPLNLLKRNIQGYSLINQPAADPVFGE
ncbi:LPS-assembly protein LptD [Candidatus Propionivibrio aalborgensis]|uniref:LPS-assembly protein LptD n=2 Tax=Candidatus Propionivibrio aalborgensis TaxID=1860101 RepID=A0A1A8XGC5_9RHOO|nr:LPS-assembly protein LptD [Candidatus Propionivibrio aalborgensis]